MKEDRRWLGISANKEPASIGFYTGVPTAGYFVKGAVSFEQAATIGSPIGYVTTVTGSPGTQVALPALDDTSTVTARQTSSAWKDDAISSPTAAKSNVYAERVTGSTSATTANQVLESVALNDNTTVILDVTVKDKLPSSVSGVTAKMQGSFTS